MPWWQWSLSAKLPSCYQTHEGIRGRSVVIKNEGDQIGKAHSQLSGVIQRSGFCWRRLSVCHPHIHVCTWPPEQYWGDAQRGYLKWEAEESQSNSRSNKYYLFPSQNPSGLLMHLFTGTLANMMWQHPKRDSALNKHKPKRGAQAEWCGHAMACPAPQGDHWGVTPCWWENTGCRVWKWCWLQPHRARRTEKNRGEWNTEQGCLSQYFATAELLLQLPSHIWVTA